MSVDYYSCDSCGDARYEEAVIECEGCGVQICNNCYVGNDDKLERCQFFPNAVLGEDGLKKEHCPFCSGEIISDSSLLDFTLEFAGLSKDFVEDAYRVKFNKEEEK